MAFGRGSNVSNLISNTGVVSSDVSGVGTARNYVGGCEYGGDKGIMAYGKLDSAPGTYQNVSNKVSNAGVVASDTAGVGTARMVTAACGYGGDKGIFGYGNTGSFVSMTNKVSSAGVVADDTTGVGTSRAAGAACEYGGTKGIFGFGYDGGQTSYTNLVSNTGVVASDQAATTGTARNEIAACEYGEDKGIFGFGHAGSPAGFVAMTNLVSNAGVVATDQAAVTGLARGGLGACEYGQDKGIFAFGAGAAGCTAVSNLVSNGGVVATDTAGVGSTCGYVGACSFN